MSWTRAYRVALHLLPTELRRKHGPEMESLFVRELERASARGSLHRSLTGAAGVLDVVWRAPYERMRLGYDVAEPAGASAEHPPVPQRTTRQLLLRHAISFGVAFVALTAALLALFSTRNLPALLGPRGAPVGTVIGVMLLAVPFTAALTIPMAVLVAVLQELTRLGVDGTLATTRRVRGGVRRLVVPLLAASLGIAALELVVVAEIVPRTNERLVVLLEGVTPASNGRTMTIDQLRAAARSARAGTEPRDLARATEYEVEIQKKFALPAACVVMALVGMAVALRVRRGGAWLVGGVSCAVFIGYYMMFVTGENLANKQVISPFLGMWGANVLVLGVVLIALWRRRAPLASRGSDAAVMRG
jgi:lipopolysaccharide export LptBFGC system permease protein LptF